MSTRGSAEDAAALVLTICRVRDRRGVAGMFVMSGAGMEIGADLMMADARQAMSDGRGEKDQRNKRMDGESDARRLRQTSSSQPAHHESIRSPARRQVNRPLSDEWSDGFGFDRTGSQNGPIIRPRGRVRSCGARTVHPRTRAPS